MNPAIATAAVPRRNSRHEDVNSALELAARRRQKQIRAAIDATDRSAALINAMKEIHTETRPPMATRIPPDTRTAQAPAILPDAPVVHAIAAHRALTARAVAMIMGGLMLFMAGVAVGSAL